MDGLPYAEAAGAQHYLDERILALWNRRERAAVDAQALILAEAIRRGKLTIPPQTAEIFLHYPKGDFKLAAATINSMMLAVQGIYPLTDWPATFWAESKIRAPCTTTMEDHEEITQTIMRREFEAMLHGSPIPVLRSALAILSHASLAKRENQDKTEAILSLLSAATRIAEDVASHGNLREPPWANFAARAIFEHTTDALYLLQQSTDVSRTYKNYGRGREKLQYKQLQDTVAQASPENQVALAKTVETLRDKANEEILEMFTDMRWDNWAGKDDARKRAYAVGREQGYRHVYAPNSDVIHGAWNATRYYDMSPCMTPSHGGHLIPRRNYKRVPGTILAILGELIWESMEATADAWDCRPDLDELLALPTEEDTTRPDTEAGSTSPRPN